MCMFESSQKDESRWQSTDSIPRKHNETLVLLRVKPASFPVQSSRNLHAISDVPESFLSRQIRVRVTSLSIQSHLNFFGVDLESSHDLVESSQS